MKGEGSGRKRTWLFLGLVVVVVVSVIVASLLQRAAPPGAQIVNKPLPADHPVGPCYQCHEGMATGQAVQGKPLPAQHPAEQCSQCHEGYPADPNRGAQAPASSPTDSGP